MDSYVRHWMPDHVGFCRNTGTEHAAIVLTQVFVSRVPGTCRHALLCTVSTAMLQSDTQPVAFQNPKIDINYDRKNPNRPSNKGFEQDQKYKLASTIANAHKHEQKW